MPVHEDDMIVSTKDYFVTENTLNPKATFAEVQEFIRKCKTSGSVTVTANGGGLRSVVVVEKSLMDDDQSNEVRRVMGMEYEVEVEGEEEEE